MARQKKKGGHAKTLKTLIMVTAILNLIKSLIDLINKLLEQDRGEGNLPSCGTKIIQNLAFVNINLERSNIMVEIIFDLASIILSVVVIVYLVKNWRNEE